MACLNMLVLNLYICIIIVSSADKDYQSHFSLDCLGDPLQTIVEFMDFREQRTARLISQRFNRWINNSFTLSPAVLLRLSVAIHRAATSIITAANDINEALSELDQIHETMNYNEEYLRTWPRIIEHYIADYIASNQSVLNHQQIQFQHPSPSNYISRTLVDSSHILFREMFNVNSSQNINFQTMIAFIYENTWRYLGDPHKLQNEIFASIRLPPFDSVPYIILNLDIWKEEMKNLKRLNIDNGFIVWLPQRIYYLSRRPVTDETFRLRYRQFRNFELWFKMTTDAQCADFTCTESENRIHRDTYLDYAWFLRTEFIFRVLEDEWFEEYYHSSVLMKDDQMELMAMDEFIVFCRDTLYYLQQNVKHKGWAVCERLELLIIENDIYELLDDITSFENESAGNLPF